MADIPSHLISIWRSLRIGFERFINRFARALGSKIAPCANPQQVVSSSSQCLLLVSYLSMSLLNGVWIF